MSFASQAIGSSNAIRNQEKFDDISLESSRRSSREIKVDISARNVLNNEEVPSRGGVGGAICGALGGAIGGTIVAGIVGGIATVEFWGVGLGLVNEGTGDDEVLAGRILLYYTAPFVAGAIASVGTIAGAFFGFNAGMEG